MTLELILFIAAILFGILLYWRETNGNASYRFFNKILNSKELQMKVTDKKGFFYQQSFLLRLVFVSILFLIGMLIFQFLIPIQIGAISVFASMITGTLIGTYIAGLIFKSSKMIEEQSDSLENIVQDTIGKGKDFIEDLTKEDLKSEPVSSGVEKKETPKEPEKSARERLKDKGLL